jgi:hypothetical protein
VAHLQRDATLRFAIAVRAVQLLLLDEVNCIMHAACLKLDKVQTPPGWQRFPCPCVRAASACPSCLPPSALRCPCTRLLQCGFPLLFVSICHGWRLWGHPGVGFGGLRVRVGISVGEVSQLYEGAPNIKGDVPHTFHLLVRQHNVWRLSARLLLSCTSCAGLVCAHGCCRSHR